MMSPMWAFVEVFDGVLKLGCEFATAGLPHIGGLIQKCCTY